MTAASAVLARVSSTLQDLGVTRRWPEADLLRWLSDGQREAVRLKPAANPVTEALQLAPGTLQKLPADGVSVIAVVRAMGINGETPGPAPRQVARAVMDAARPSWHTDTASLEPDEWLYDDQSPAQFWVHPGQPDPAGLAEVIYAAVPDEIAATADAITLSDMYLPALVDYVLYRALSQERTEAQLGKAAAYRELFEAAFMGRRAAKEALHPEQAAERARK